MTLPTIAFDEAGNTGENLLDPVQPIFALASVHLDVDQAAHCLRDTFGERQTAELKFASLRKRGRGQRQLLEFLESGLLGPDNTRVAIAHKPWMLASKMIDILVEPFANMRGWSAPFYREGVHLKMADALHARAADVIGAQNWSALQRTFVAVIRDPDTDRVAAFHVALDEARAACRVQAISAVLDAMAVSARELPELAGGEQLDPAPTMLLEQIGAWSKRLGGFRVVHDDSTVLRRWQEGIERFFHAEPGVIDFGEGRELRLPFKAEGLEFAESHRTANVQVADLVAGASAWMYLSASGSERADDFASALVRTPLPSLVAHILGPPGLTTS